MQSNKNFYLLFYFKIIILTPGWTHGENYEVLVGKIGLEVPRKSRIVKKEGKGGGVTLAYICSI
jgi:hypothetical protein